MPTKILVADDSATIQKVIKIAFARLSYEIIEAFSYPQAVNLITSNQTPAMVILDANLPGLQGPEGVRKMMSEKKFPILLLVGTYDTIDEDSYRNAGFSHFLRKPFESTDIVAAVEKLIPPASQPTPPSIRSALPPAPTPGGVPPPLPVTPWAQPAYPPQTPQAPQPLQPPPLPPHPPVAPLPFDLQREPPPFEFKLQETPPVPNLPHAPPVPPVPYASHGTVPPPLPPLMTRVPAGSSLQPKHERSSVAATLVEPPPSQEPDPSGFAVPQISSFKTFPGSSAFQESPREGESSDTGHGGDRGAANLRLEIRAEILQVIKNDLPLLVSLAVGEYCERHFGPLAKEIIQAELRRLVDEKTRQLVDN